MKPPVRVAIAILAAVTALVLAGCGDDDDSTTEATPSPQQKIEQTGKKWARLFAASHDRAACKVMSQPGCAQLNCEHRQTRLGAPDDVIPIRNCTPPSAGFRKSFADATVEDIAIKGKQAGARFSNGEGVELFWVNGHAVAGVWWIDKVGGNAGRTFFGAAENDGDRRLPPAGTLLLQPNAQRADDREAGVRFSLDGRVLTVRLLASAPRKTRRRVNGARIRATCGKGFRGGPGPGPFVDTRQTRTRL